MESLLRFFTPLSKLPFEKESFNEYKMEIILITSLEMFTRSIED